MLFLDKNEMSSKEIALIASRRWNLYFYRNDNGAFSISFENCQIFGKQMAK